MAKYKDYQKAWKQNYNNSFCQVNNKPRHLEVVVQVSAENRSTQKG